MPGRAFKPRRLWPILYELARLGALDGIEMTTRELAGYLDVSQQSASRYLIEMEELGWVERLPPKSRKRMNLIRITPKGLERLRQVHKSLSEIIGGKQSPIVLKGKVFTGIGEGAFYVSLPGYREQFKRFLNFDPYPGTLNVRIPYEDLPLRKKLEESIVPIKIKGFHYKGKIYGDVRCYPVLIQGKIRGAIVDALRRHYGPSVIELIAPVCLREELQLKDGDVVEIRA